MTLRTKVVKEYAHADAPSFRLEVDATFAPGVTAIFGASGSGKSTWLECAAGLQRPDAGMIGVEDRVLFDAASGVDIPPARRNLGYIFQDAALFPHLSVRANVEYGLGHKAAGQRRGEAQSLLETFRVSHLANINAQRISGGERQRVALARAVVRAPECLLMDEPFSALDYETKLRIMDDLQTWNRDRRIPMVLVTHALEEVLALAERVIVLEQGRIVADGDPRQVLSARRERLLARLASPPQQKTTC